MNDDNDKVEISLAVAAIVKAHADGKLAGIAVAVALATEDAHEGFFSIAALPGISTFLLGVTQVMQHDALDRAFKRSERLT